MLLRAQITNAPRGGTGKELAELHEAARALVKSMNSRWALQGLGFRI
jgi:hypothetical protein